MKTVKVAGTSSSDLRQQSQQHRLLETTILPDTFNLSFIFPGFSLHDELELFVASGFTPFEALQTATRNPAAFLGLIKDLGTIQKGKLADLVILESNPLEDIRNTRKIFGVVVNGRYLPKESLQTMLDEAEMKAKKSDQ